MGGVGEVRTDERPVENLRQLLGGSRCDCLYKWHAWIMLR